MSGRVGVEQTPDIETVLAEHEWLQYVEYGPCTCGDQTAFTAATHRAHVAAALAPVLADAVREARAAELREAADDLTQFALTDFDACGPKSLRGASIWDSAQWLRDRADRIAVDAPEGGAR